MPVWIPVCPIVEFPVRTCRRVDAHGDDVLVVNLDGEYFAVDNVCSHDYAELSEGEIEGDEVVCPLHGARFDLRTGEVTAPPAYEALRTYATRVNGGVVEVAQEE